MFCPFTFRNAEPKKMKKKNVVLHADFVCPLKLMYCICQKKCMGWRQRPNEWLVYFFKKNSYLQILSLFSFHYFPSFVFKLKFLYNIMFGVFLFSFLHNNFLEQNFMKYINDIYVMFNQSLYFYVAFTSINNISKIKVFLKRLKLLVL